MNGDPSTRRKSRRSKAPSTNDTDNPKGNKYGEYKSKVRNGRARGVEFGDR